MPERILIIEDDRAIRDILSNFLNSLGYETITSSTGKEGVETYKRESFDVALLDMVLPEIDGIHVLKDIKVIDPQAVVIMVTAYGTIETAVEAMKAGAFDYITKPFRLDDVHFAIKKGINLRKLEKENISLKKELKHRYGFENIIGDSQSMINVYSIIEKVAPTDSTILIYGESGTGKELIARTIHYNSDRESKPFIVINCGAIPNELIESELFGHERGAFTGAISTKLGKFELADRGTLFLDEIGELNFPLQVKLLRVLQERSFERVGGTKNIKVDVRIIAATNKNLEEEVRQNKFREDLFYRLNVIPIYLPPLREKKEDIPLLCHYFLEKYCKKRNRQLLKFSNETITACRDYNWPGNVRELENLIERLTVLKEDDFVLMNDLPEKFFPKRKFENLINVESLFGDGIDLKRTVEDFEKKLILEALKFSNGKKSKAADYLKINRTTLIEKLKRLKI